jgi:glycosyltransferase involved in cell wall biosynthesis
MVQIALISVVIPAHNEERYITASLASIAAQTHPLSDLECVVVDNCSTDQTAEVVARFAAEHADLRITVVSEPEAGVSRAKNRGAKAANGEVLVFLDADSRMTPSLIADIIAHRVTGHPAGSIRIVADSTDPLEHGFFALLELGKVLFGIRAQMLYCDRALFLALGGFRPELHQAEDLDFLQGVRRHLSEHGSDSVCHVRSSAIATSTRRLRGGPFRRNLIATFVRWLLASVGIGREWKY